MKLPNGYGSVYKLSGKRRKPWTARKTIGWVTNEKTGRSAPVYQFIGYYATRAEALTALSDYNKDPYDLDARKVTFGELYDKWSSEHYPKINSKTAKNYVSSYVIWEPIKDTPIADIKLTRLQDVINMSGKGKSVANRAKIIASFVFAYAVKHEILPADKADIPRYIDTSNISLSRTVDHEVFGVEEVERLWSHTGSAACRSVLIMIYTGMRISELIELKKSNVHYDERWLDIVDAKTDAGIRQVPIAEKIAPFINDLMQMPGDYLYTKKSGKRYYYDSFRYNYWDAAMHMLGSAHHPHDSRYTCITMLTEAEVDARTIRQIVGHKGDGVTEQVYTHIRMSVKLEAINRI